MHPAYSIIWFTTLSGAGYGLAAFLGLGIVAVQGWMAALAYGLAFALIGGGLMSSTFHLGHPERAWRALSQWRSSWLSREGVLALATFAPLSASAVWAIVFGQYLPGAGVVLALLCGLTVYATSMIYASLRTVHQWHTWATSACYLAFAASSGFVLLIAISAPLARSGIASPAAMALMALAWTFKLMWWHRADTSQSASTASSALGLPESANPRRLEAPHTGTNYLCQEMGYKIARKHGARLRAIAVGLGGLVPVLCLFAAGTLNGFAAQALVAVAAVTHFAGIVVERWLFFAQARHVVMLYYGAYDDHR
ncbi:Anaerobic dimethyl sulfoxide reductase chain C, anchor subunit [hydrothermal vent metagenome]|uniref:Anaerobic dimethyl sulfoxide reductase chain C, anchor subunit n=1 Tax=hydrothermal vent metagenome TaxID=652676 RepID=A0A3B0TRZ2_9ZZZZ